MVGSSVVVGALTCKIIRDFSQISLVINCFWLDLRFEAVRRERVRKREREGVGHDDKCHRDRERKAMITIMKERIEM